VDTAAPRRALTEVRWENLALLDLESATKEFALQILSLLLDRFAPVRKITVKKSKSVKPTQCPLTTLRL
jgi:hypothetical protein